MKSKIYLFGKLRKFSLHGIIELETYQEMTPQELRLAVAEKIRSENIDFLGIQELNSSAVANDTKILREKEPIGNGLEFSLLPPVCGG